MKQILFTAVALSLAIVSPWPAAAKEKPASWDGLVEVRSPRMDMVYLMPGADFRPYTRVMLDTPEVAFQKNWLRTVNDSAAGRRVTEADAGKILESVKADTSDILAQSLAAKGFEVVQAPGPDVLRIRSGIIDLYVNAPDSLSAGMVRTYTTHAGEATLVLEVRDSLTNALMARVVDRRETRQSVGRTTSASNTADFRALARQWADTSAKGLEALKALSPIPDPLEPGQKLD